MTNAYAVTKENDPNGISPLFLVTNTYSPVFPKATKPCFHRGLERNGTTIVTRRKNVFCFVFVFVLRRKAEKKDEREEGWEKKRKKKEKGK